MCVFSLCSFVFYVRSRGWGVSSPVHVFFVGGDDLRKVRSELLFLRN